ncbi:MAG: ChrR family anti-sigma-E factor [Spongiibacteraceae bacterium]
MKHHPDYEWLEQYAAGSLSVGPALCVAAHMALCIACRNQVAAMQRVGGALLTEIGSMPIGDSVLQAIFAKIDSEPAATVLPVIHNTVVGAVDSDIPTPLRQWVSRGYDRLTWSRALPSLRIAALDVGDEQYQVALHRIGAGGSVATHDHSGSELTLVLRGSFSDEAGVYSSGDFLVREPNQPHRPIAAQNGECICLAAVAGPVRFTGPLMRWVNPLLR